MAFNNTWNALQNHLRVGSNIPKWTAYNGLLGGSFSITSVDPQFIEVDSPGAQDIQKAHRRDFESVYNLWDDYNQNIVGRHEIRDLTHFSTYIIGILHWLENQLGGQLP